MLKAARLAFKAASNAGVLPAFGWLLLVVAAASAAAGGWAGMRWERGAQAIQDKAVLQAQAEADRAAIDELKRAARELQQQAVDDTAARRQALDEQAAIAARLEDTLDANQAFARRQQGELDALLARRPDLRTLRLGADVLRLWNDGNAGRAATDSAQPAARPAGKPAAPVPAAPARQERPGAGSAAEPRRGGGAVSRLRLPHGQPAAVDRGLAGDRVALVLPGGAAGGVQRCRLQRGGEVSGEA